MVVELHPGVAEEDELSLTFLILVVQALKIMLIEIQRKLYRMRGKNFDIAVKIREIVGRYPEHSITSLNVEFELTIEG